MITCISYGDKKYIEAARLNLETAKAHGADDTILYQPSDIPIQFKIKNWRIYYGRTGRRFERKGAGYWIWKPYIIMDALKRVEENDIIIYSDGGSVYIDDIDELINTFNANDEYIMAFSLRLAEKEYTKRDAFILLKADTPEYADSRQRVATYIVLKKCEKTMNFVGQWLKYSQDYRIITNEKNKMGEDNYSGFVSHRNDQSIFSLLAKKNNLKEYRDPSQWGNYTSKWPIDIIERSKYPQIWYSTRNSKITSMEEFRTHIIDPHEVCDYEVYLESLKTNE